MPGRRNPYFSLLNLKIIPPATSFRRLIPYMAGVVEKTLKKQGFKVDGGRVDGTIDGNRGGLIVPKESIFKVVEMASSDEYFFRMSSDSVISQIAQELSFSRSLVGFIIRALRNNVAKRDVIHDRDTYFFTTVSLRSGLNSDFK